jgi:hypothetical protein
MIPKRGHLLKKIVRAMDIRPIPVGINLQPNIADIYDGNRDKRHLAGLEGVLVDVSACLKQRQRQGKYPEAPCCQKSQPIAVRQRRSERLRLAHLSTSKYCPTAAATFLRFRIRAATSPDESSRLTRSTRRTGGIPELDMAANLSTEASRGGTRATARVRPGMVERRVMLRVSTS